MRVRKITRRAIAVAAALTAAAPVLAVSGTAAASHQSGVFVRTIHLAGHSGTSNALGTPPQTAVQSNELGPDYEVDSKTWGHPSHDRSLAPRRNQTDAPSAPLSGSGAGVTDTPAGFEGLNAYLQRYIADDGNQYQLEPPDQGLCVGNGKIFEAVNTAVATYQSDGTMVDGTLQSLNRFYNYPSELDWSTGVFGPTPTDPTCLYDAATNRFYLVMLTLETDPTTGDLTLANHLDLAVSKTGNPTGSWNIYKIDVTDDGSDNGLGADPTHPNCPCIGDYPHIGADANGIYITTNEYPWLTDGFNGAQIYALPKAALASGASDVTVTQIDTSAGTGSSDGIRPGFTVWPAQTPQGSSYDTSRGGTEYFLSSNAAEEAGGNYVGDEVVLWALRGTSTLGDDTPNVRLVHRDLGVTVYSLPPQAEQPPGDWPLGQCLNLPKCAVWLNGSADGPNEHLGKLDSNDTRMQQVTYAGGKVYGALDTAVSVDGATQSGVAWYAVSPDNAGRRLNGQVADEGQIGVAGGSITYPAIGVNSDGDGAMGVTLVGAGYHPSAAYLPISNGHVARSVKVLGVGVGTQDGFTEYRYAPQPNTAIRPRWGDYGATAVDGSGNIWLANEWIAQSCTLSEFRADPHCDGTRASISNWSTHIAKVTP